MLNVDVAAAPASGEIRPWLAKGVRLGYAAKGTIYILIGVLAFRVAAGFGGGKLTDSSGALVTILRQPFGNTLLTVIGIGLLAYAAWLIGEGFFDPYRKGRDAKGFLSRALTMVRGAIYGGIGWQACRLAFGGGSSRGSSGEYAADVMRLPLGEWILVTIGVGVGAYGVHQLWAAYQCRLGSDLDAGDLRRVAGEWAVVVSRVGQGARGVILALVGMSAVRAGLERQASEVEGTAGSLRSLLTQPYGPWLLGAVAAGLVCYGVFQLLHARYARL